MITKHWEHIFCCRSQFSPHGYAIFFKIENHLYYIGSQHSGRCICLHLLIIFFTRLWVMYFRRCVYWIGMYIEIWQKHTKVGKYIMYHFTYVCSASILINTKYYFGEIALWYAVSLQCIARFIEFIIQIIFVFLRTFFLNICTYSLLEFLCSWMRNIAELSTFHCKCFSSCIYYLIYYYVLASAVLIDRSDMITSSHSLSLLMFHCYVQALGGSYILLYEDQLYISYCLILRIWQYPIFIHS